MPNPRIIDGYGGSLVAITAQATLNPGDSIDLPVDALRNGLGETLLVDTFRWTVDAQQNVASGNPPTSAVGFPGGSVAASVRFGGKPLTGGEVPLYCFGLADGQDVESVVLGVADNINTETLLGAYSSGVWDFDHPMSMDGGDAFSVHVTHLGLLNLPVVVTLAITGRAGAGLPRSKWLPYVAAWTPKALIPTVPTSTVPVVITSTERDLVNRVPGTLQVARFIGRLMRTGVTGTPPGGTAVQTNAEQVFPTVEGAYSALPSSDWFPNAVDSFAKITIRDSRANDNVPVALPFRQVFEPQSRAWECPHEVEENGYYIAQLTLTVPGVTSDASIQPAVAMIGSWEGA